MTRPKLIFTYDWESTNAYYLTYKKFGSNANLVLVTLGDYWYITQISATQSNSMIKIIEGFDFKNEVELRKID